MIGLPRRQTQAQDNGPSRLTLRGRLPTNREVLLGSHSCPTDRTWNRLAVRVLTLALGVRERQASRRREEHPEDTVLATGTALQNTVGTGKPRAVKRPAAAVPWRQNPAPGRSTRVWPKGLSALPDVRVCREHAVLEGFRGHPADRQQSFPTFPIVIRLVDVPRHAKIYVVHKRQTRSVNQRQNTPVGNLPRSPTKAAQGNVGCPKPTIYSCNGSTKSLLWRLQSHGTPGEHLFSPPAREKGKNPAQNQCLAARPFPKAGPRIAQLLL